MNSISRKPCSSSLSSSSSSCFKLTKSPSTAPTPAHFRTTSFCRSCKIPLGTPKDSAIFKLNQSLPVKPFAVVVSPILKTIQSFRWTHRYLQDPAVDKIAGCGATANGAVLQNGGLGLALLSVTTTAKVRISPFLSTLAANPTFVSWVLAWFAAQSIKVVLNFFVERKWDLRILFASGGMPSSHSALCTALTTSVAICHGVADSLFPVCLGFSLIVMYDAIGVRRHAGMQAEVLNKIIEDLFQGHPISERKLKELLGHTPSQVVAGAVLGILVACLCCQNFLASV